MALTFPSDIDLAWAQLRPILRNPRFWISLVALGLVIGITGPFGTMTALPVLPRLAYWVFMVVVTGAIGLILCRSLSTMLARSGLPRLWVALLAGLVAGGPISLLVHGLNALLLRPGDVALGPEALTASLFAISAFISVAVSQIFFADPPAAPVLRPYTPAPRLLNRLPKDIRAPLVALTATDHYTEVTTTAGSALVLIRLSDAIAEAAPTPGLRIHRSHWIALDQITAARRDGPRASITLTTGTDLPVSRSHLAALEQTGLLPPR
ncbi:MAG: LytTR family transcriptional regulator DNA-binding domain-containing protein [Rhodobacteraceae bacterium]|nr:LytTR family transcriptional regulator DNA-binding domain-containing protein [Paracoccaceae bacterium]MCZ8084193.1 LytTR family transcriptional regulator DNA-binding domain-containing protein [Paracoccaceae bacterium]